MHKIDSDGATVDNLFTEGNPATSVPATIVSAAILNAFQEEIVKVVEESGQTLLTSSTDSFDQLYTGILNILKRGGEVVTQALDNNAGPLDIGGAGVLEFDPSLVSTVSMDYRISRRTDSQNVIEVGTLRLIYDTESSSWRDPEWQSNGDDAGTIFSLGTVSGGANNGFAKIQYTTQDLTGTTYSGDIKITNLTVINQ